VSIKAPESINIPEGYEAVYVLVGYNESGQLSCCEANRNWAPYYPEGPDFIDEPEHYLFLRKIREIKERPVFKFIIEDNGTIVPFDEASKKS
jgi:hypothetical protein